MSLKEIFCQDRAISILQRAYTADKVSHAYIFAGSEGVGKFTTAREYGKLLLCKDPVVKETDRTEFADSCGSCESCRLFEADSHPDFHHIYKELAQFTKEGKDKKTPLELPIDVVREFLIQKASIKPTLSRRKVFVVSEAEKLNISSQNALLKVLEEPPEYCCIILLCTRMEMLLATTKSRCQIIRFTPIAEDRIIEKLKETGIEKTEATYFARLAQGSLGRACQWARLELAGANLYETKKRLLTALADSKLADALDQAGQLLDESKAIAAAWADLDETTSRTDINRKAQKTLVQMLISALHDTMTRSITPAEDHFNFDQRDQIEKLALRFGHEQAAQKIADCYKTLHWIESNVNEKLIFEQLLLNLAVPDRITS